MEKDVRTWDVALADVGPTVIGAIAEGDLVCAYKAITGVHTSDASLITRIAGAPPPTGRRVSIPITDVSRYRDRQISEHWHVSDFRNLLLAGFPAPATAPMSDSAATTVDQGRARGSH